MRLYNEKKKIPENAGEMQVTGKFKKGESGNPKGKIKGTKNRITLTAEQLLEGELDNICRRLIEEALKGNMQAIKLILDRIMPPRKDRSLEIKIPKLNSPDDALNAISVIANAVACGGISPSEGESISRILDMYVKTVNTCDFNKRIKVLETKAVHE